VEVQTKRTGIFKSTLEILAIAGPILCAIHCLILPVVIAVLPFVGLQHLYHGFDEQLLTVFMLAVCIPVLVPGFLKHRKKRVLVMMVAAFALIFLAQYMEHSIDQTMHTVVALFGSALLLKANFDNYRLTHQHSHSCGHGHAPEHT